MIKEFLKIVIIWIIIDSYELNYTERAAAVQICPTFLELDFAKYFFSFNSWTYRKQD